MHGPWRRGKGRRTFSIIALRSTSSASLSHLENAEKRTVVNDGGVCCTTGRDKRAVNNIRWHLMSFPCT